MELVYTKDPRNVISAEVAKLLPGAIVEISAEMVRVTAPDIAAANSDKIKALAAVYGYQEKTK